MIPAHAPTLALPGILLACLTLASCDYLLPEGIEVGHHRISVQQGNVLQEEAVRNLRIGMDREKVLFLLGTPMIQDTFNPDRWDYAYYKEKTSPDELSELDVLSLRFENDLLKEVVRLVPIDAELAGLEPSGDLDMRDLELGGEYTPIQIEADPIEEEEFEPVGVPAQPGELEE